METQVSEEVTDHKVEVLLLAEVRSVEEEQAEVAVEVEVEVEVEVDSEVEIDLALLGLIVEEVGLGVVIEEDLGVAIEEIEEDSGVVTEEEIDLLSEPFKDRL